MHSDDRIEWLNDKFREKWLGEPKMKNCKKSVVNWIDIFYNEMATGRIRLILTQNMGLFGRKTLISHVRIVSKTTDIHRLMLQ